MEKKVNVPKPPKGCTTAEKLEFYDKLIQDGLNTEELKVVKRRINFIDTYFENLDVQATKELLLQCIEEMLEE